MNTPRSFHIAALATALVVGLAVSGADSNVPQQLNYQGRVTVQGVNYQGPGQFKFALVDGGVNHNQTATAFVNSNGAGGVGPVISVLNGGLGYVTPPLVTISPPDLPIGGGGEGVQATAVAYLDGAFPDGGGGGAGGPGVVTSIVITNPGAGYTGAGFVTVTLSAPSPNLVTTTWWSNDGTSLNGAGPTHAVSLPVDHGLYSVALGDTALNNMTAVPASVFTEPAPLPPIPGYIPGPKEVRLRVWFDDGTHGFQQLSPDQKINSVGFAYLAGAVPDGAITSARLADASVTASKLANGVVSTAKLAAGAIGPAQLAGKAPQNGQLLSYNAADSNFKWVPAGGVGADGLNLPIYQVGIEEENHYLFNLSNQGHGDAIVGESSEGQGVVGKSSGAGKAGVHGLSDLGDGLYGESFRKGYSGVYGRNNNSEGGYGIFGAGGAGIGVRGDSANNAGVYGQTYGVNQAGVAGFTDAADSTGVNGLSIQGDGVRAESRRVGYSGIYAQNNTSGGFGVYGKAGDGAVGVYGTSVGKEGVVGFSGASHGVSGFANQANQAGVLAVNNVSGGLGLEVLGNAVVHGTATVRVLTIDNGADIAEPFAIGGGEELPRGSVVVIGEEPTGELRRSEQAYDTRVAGIVSGANGVNTGLSLSQPGVNDTGGQRVALTGRVYCLADARFGAIRPGDLLTTSGTPGHAMKVSDHGRAQGAVLGKAMSALDEGTGYVLVLVTLQ